MTLIPTFCGKDCGGDACPIQAQLDDGRVTRMTKNPAGGKYLQGCTRGFGLPLETYASDRILHPLVRVGRAQGHDRVLRQREASDRQSQPNEFALI